MSKVITITLSDEKYKEFWAEVGEIVGLASYLEADVTIRNAPKFASGGFVSGSSYGTRLTEPV